MRKITSLAISAFMSSTQFSKSNTAVEVLPNVTILKLHGNPIAYRYNDPQRTVSVTNAGWKSNTTKERLNGLPGVSIYQRNFKWFLTGSEWDGKITDIS